MHYTLYIDESGDFTRKRGDWIVGGLLVPYAYNDAEKALETVGKRALISFTLTERKQLHLTHLRTVRGAEAAQDVARYYLHDCVESHAGTTLLTVHNTRHSIVGDREKTYRAMLLDALALADSVLLPASRISSLDLVVATRTIDGVSVTTVADIETEVLESIPVAMEAGLASRGLVDSFNRHKLHIFHKPASTCWGLCAADMLCNTAYNRSRESARRLLDELEDEGYYYSFVSSGSHEQRRARILERDGDYPGAIIAWLSAVKMNGDEERVFAVRKLLLRIVRQGGSNGPRASLEMILERLWRSLGGSGAERRLYGMLRVLDRALDGTMIADADLHAVLLFRVRNFRLLLANRLLEFDDIGTLLEEQKKHLSRLSSQPEHLQLILNYQLYEIESCIPLLEATRRVTLAERAQTFVATYRTLWSMLDEDVASPDGQATEDRFEASRISVRIRGSLLRSRLAVIPYGAHERCEALVGEIEKLHDRAMTDADRDRMSSLRLLAMRHCGLVPMMLEQFGDDMPEHPSPYDLYSLMLMSVDLLFAGHKLGPAVAKRVRERWPREDFDGAQSLIHLVLWRERALLAHLGGEGKDAAMKALRQAWRSAAVLNMDSPMGRWLAAGLEAVEGLIFDRDAKALTQYFERYIDQRETLDTILHATSAEGDSLMAFRSVHPF